MKRLNNKGFAITTLLYGLMIMSLLVVIALVTNLGTNRSNTSTFVEKIEDELNRLSITNTEGDYIGGDVDSQGREYIAPTAGWYKIELWGAAGGGTNGGRGAYTSGIMYLEANDRLYFYVGAQGGTSASSFNGGGAGASSNYFAGGGATDVRLISSTWNDEESLDSRLMVAAGGAGAGNGSEGGVGGYLTGGNGKGTASAIGQAGTQSAGGAGAGAAGSFGIAGDGGSNSAGGGGGYFGGAASGANASAGGGSSFIIGYAGSRAATDGTAGDQPTKTYNVHRGDYDDEGNEIIESYTPVIYNGLMIAGVNDGAGKFRVSKVSDNDSANPPKKGSNAKLNQVRYIRDCVDGNTVDNNGYWLEIQAISNGTNLALGKAPAGSGGTASDLNYITDGSVDDIASVGKITGSGNKCVQIDLGAPVDLDEIAVWHQYQLNNSTVSFKNHTLSVSTNGSTWQTIRGNSSDTSDTGITNEEETSNGIHYNTFHADALGEIPDGNYYIVSANSDKMALTAAEEGSNNFAKMDYFTGDATQVWYVYKQTSASGAVNYHMVSTSNQLACTVTGAGTSSIIRLSANGNGDEQGFNITPLGNGYYTITSNTGNRLGYSTSSISLETQSVTQEKTQRWKFVLAEY